MDFVASPEGQVILRDPRESLSGPSGPELPEVCGWMCSYDPITRLHISLHSKRAVGKTEEGQQQNHDQAHHFLWHSWGCELWIHAQGSILFKARARLFLQKNKKKNKLKFKVHHVDKTQDSLQNWASKISKALFLTSSEPLLVKDIHKQNHKKGFDCCGWMEWMELELPFFQRTFWGHSFLHTNYM